MKLTFTDPHNDAAFLEVTQSEIEGCVLRFRGSNFDFDLRERELTMISNFHYSIPKSPDFE